MFDVVYEFHVVVVMPEENVEQSPEAIAKSILEEVVDQVIGTHPRFCRPAAHSSYV